MGGSFATLTAHNPTDALISFSGIYFRSMDSQTTTHQDEAAAFRRTLLNTLTDGTVFLDRNLRVTAWNRRLENMTGLAAKNVLNKKYDLKMLGFKDPVSGKPVPENRDPIALLLKTVDTVKSDYRIAGSNGQELNIKLTGSPVIDSEGQFIGCILLIHDGSAELDLKRQLQDLHAFSILDPLTQVANRAAFERAMVTLTRDRKESDEKFSLIVADIDFFKQINDNYNHHIGDQALVAFSQILKIFVSDQDVLARFGGEEFVILCHDSDLEDAAQRAEEIRQELNQTSMPMLDGKYITASFGVSELLPGDSPTDLFVRADTALIQAKEAGRNRVITSSPNPLSHPTITPPANDSTRDLLTGISWPSLEGDPIICDKFKTRTPIPILVEKLRGFIVEMDAELRNVEADHAVMILEFEDPNDYSRKGRFEVRIDFVEDVEGETSKKHGRRTYTFLRIAIRLAKRKWFRTNAPDLADDLLNEIRSYFMITSDADIVQGIKPATEPKDRWSQ